MNINNLDVYIYKYIIHDRLYINYLSYLYIRILFNECLLTGININTIFYDIKNKNTFINILLRYFSHIFCEYDINILSKNYSYQINMTSIHLSEYHNMVSLKTFLNDIYEQGLYYNTYLRKILFSFFFKNSNIFYMYMNHGQEKNGEDNLLLSCEKLKQILCYNGIFLSWAEIYDFFQPLNKYCVIYHNRSYDKRHGENETPYILKAYINIYNLVSISRRMIRGRLDDIKNVENVISVDTSINIENYNKNEISGEIYDEDQNKPIGHNNYMNKNISDHIYNKKVLQQDSMEERLSNVNHGYIMDVDRKAERIISSSKYNNNKTCVLKRDGSVEMNNEIEKEDDTYLCSTKYINRHILLCHKIDEDVKDEYTKNQDTYNNNMNTLFKLNECDKKKGEIKNMSLNKNDNIKKGCYLKCKSQNDEKDNKLLNNKNITTISNYMSPCIYSNMKYNILETSNNIFYNLSFTKLTLGRLLYLLFLKMNNLMIKKKLYFEQIYFGMKNINYEDIKKKRNGKSVYFIFKYEK